METTLAAGSHPSGMQQDASVEAGRAAEPGATDREGTA